MAALIEEAMLGNFLSGRDDQVVLAKKGTISLDKWQMVPGQSNQLTNFIADARQKHPQTPSSPHLPKPVYQPLCIETKDIRVLELFPGAFEDDLQGELHICSIQFQYKPEPVTQSAAVKDLKYDLARYNVTSKAGTDHAVSLIDGKPVWYTALSYVWGDPAQKFSMSCNGVSIDITTNLNAALRHLRDTEHSVMLWCDQLCINQPDLTERSHQILLMDSIYSQAYSTLVWLGEDDGDTEQAFSSIKDINKALHYYTDEHAPAENELERLGLPPAGSVLWAGITRVFNKEWFQRLWIIQELALSSRSVHVLCGLCSMSWNQIGFFATIAEKHNLTRFMELSGQSTFGLQRATNLENIKNVQVGQSNGDVYLNLLVSGRSSRATVPRDKVYGIMALTSTKLLPDYRPETTDFQVFWQAGVKAITDEYNFPLNVLYCVDHEAPLPGYPSWVPDWSKPRVTETFGYRTLLRRVHRAAGDTEALIRLSEDQKCVHTKAIVVDTVNTMSDVIANPDLASLMDAGPKKAHVSNQIIVKFVATLNTSATNSASTLFESFMRTCFAGTNHTGRDATPDEWAPVFGLLLDTMTGNSPSLAGQTYHPKRRLNLDNLKRRRPAQIYAEMQPAFIAALKSRRLGVTKERRLGVFPRGSRSGDHVVILFGGHVPFVMRSTGKDRHFQLIGECYIDGLMDGKGIQVESFEHEIVIE